MKTTRPSAVALVVLASAALPVIAQPEDKPAEQPAPNQSSDSSETAQLIEEGDPIQFSFRAGTTYFADADFDDSSGSVEAWRVSTGVGAGMDVADGRLSIGFDAEHTSYDFTTTAGGGGGGGAGDVPPLRGGGGGGGGSVSVFDDVTTLTLSANYAHQINDQGDQWFVGGAVSSASESGASFDDSISGMVFGGFRHRVNDKLQLGIGVAVKSRLEDDALVIPLPQFKYNMGNGWSFESQRFGAKLMYAANESLSFGISGEYTSRTFRLDDSNTVSKGAATETRIPIAFRAEYAPNKKMRLHGQLGAAIGSELEFFNSSGTSLSTREMDPSVFFGFGGTILF